MTIEAAIECIECGASPDCFLCPTNKKHGGDCEGAELVCEALNMALEILEKVRDGKMIELPCKVGDTVYSLSPYSDTIFKATVDEVSMVCDYCGHTGKTHYNWEIFAVSVEDDNFTFGDTDIGKSVFLTREEAEKALKEEDYNA